MDAMLIRHESSRCDAVTRIETEMARASGGKVKLDYVVHGRIAELCLPAPTKSGRANELWRHTCFELFVRSLENEAYYEFNFAPSRQWAAYRFDEYRRGMNRVERIAPPLFESASSENRYWLEASLDLDMLPDLPDAETWRCGIAAIIEEPGGNISYWALSHSPGKPDFHNSDCFDLVLPPAYPRR